MDGFDFRLSKSEIEQLGRRSGQFEYVEFEEELVNRYLKPGNKEVEGKHEQWLYTATDLCLLFDQHVPRKQSLSIVKLGKALAKLGFADVQARKNGSKNPSKCWVIADDSYLLELERYAEVERERQEREDQKDRYRTGMIAS